MRITILCTDSKHPVNAWILWLEHHSNEDVVVCRDKSELPGGDLLFLVSCSQIINSTARAKYRHTFVLHASDLPKGRGWSPHIWSLLDGAKEITVSLIAAEDGVDTGAIWAQRTISIPAHALYDEIDRALFDVELDLMDEALRLVKAGASPRPQLEEVKPTYFRKRTPADSELDPQKSLAELFNAIRVAHPKRYPAFFQLHGHTYTIELKKVDLDEDDQN